MASSYIDLPAYGSPSWKNAVVSAAALPASGNSPGDARVALDTDIIYIWTGSAWTAATGASGVTTLNGLTGGVNITAGAGITVTPSGQNISIASITPNAVQAVELTFTANMNISAMQMVISVDGVSATPGNNNTTVQNAQVLGIAKTTALATTSFKALLFGTIADSSFSGFSVNGPVYLNSTGFLTQSVPVTPNFLVVCGKYLGANTVLIDVSEPVQL